MTIADLGTPTLVAIFAAAALVVVLAGMLLTGRADVLADRTGFGEALVGAVLLGAATSLSGTVVSITAALEARPSLAFSNAVGGIAVQTAFLALADLTHRRANLEHSAAELTNLFQTGLLLLMLSLPLLAAFGPPASIAGVHPVSLVLFLAYLGGLKATRAVQAAPMWKPVSTPETRKDTPDDDEGSGQSTTALALEFAGLVAALGVAGFLLAQTAGTLTDRFGLQASLVGALATAVITSLPELVTTLAAVRRGALQLAVGGIIGGNSFDTLFLTLGDVAYRDGSLYHAVGSADLFWLALGIAMTAILLLGLLMRERQGPAGIGFESIGILGIYAIGILTQSIWGGGA